MAASMKKKRTRKLNKTNVECENIKLNASQFLSDRKNSNKLLDILATAESSDCDVIVASIKALHRIFTHLIRAKQISKPNEGASDKDLGKEEKYKVWLNENYNDCVKTFLQTLIHHEHSNIQELSLCTVMKFVAVEGQNPIKHCTKKQLHFATELYEMVLKAVLSSNKSMVTLIDRMQEYMEYDDVRYFTLKLSLKILKSQQECSDMFLKNMLAVLTNISMPNQGEDDLLTKCLADPPGPETNTKMFSLVEQKKHFTTLWVNYLKNKLSINLYKKVLVIVHEKVMPFMTSPLFLSDFLTVSYNIGGVVSLLALNGLFILMQKHNLNYPDFYQKLYKLLEPAIFHVKYCARFFYLLDLFLSSTHLPSYLVASFIKKLSRLSLTAPVSSLAFLIPLIYNLIIRHPSCVSLIHRTDIQDVVGDPYLYAEVDLTKTRALDSSLWEIQAMQNHYHLPIVNIARKLENNLPGHEMDISDKLELTSHELFDRSMKKKYRDVPLTFQPPTGLFMTEDDTFHNNWLLE